MRGGKQNEYSEQGWGLGMLMSAGCPALSRHEVPAMALGEPSGAEEADD